MYEKLDKLRGEVRRCKKKLEYDKQKLRVAEQKLMEAEHTQILNDVNALNLTPEQLAEFLKLVTNGQPEAARTSVAVSAKDDTAQYSGTDDGTSYSADDESTSYSGVDENTPYSENSEDDYGYEIEEAEKGEN